MRAIRRSRSETKGRLLWLVRRQLSLLIRGQGLSVTVDLKLQAEVTGFREWAVKYPVEERSDEWECDYPEWSRLNVAVLNFIERRSPDSWTNEQLQDVLYAIARDNEISFLAFSIGRQHPEALLYLAKAALDRGEPCVKWQLAVELGKTHPLSTEVEGLLLRMAQQPGDADEYVRRRTLMILAEHNSPHTEKLAFTAWDQPGENQQWTRMAALWSLHRVRSSSLEELLSEAEVDARPHLSDYAQKMRRGVAED